MCSHGLQQNSPRKPEAPGKGCLSSLPVCRLGNSYLLDETLEIPRTPLHLCSLLGLCSHLQWVPPFNHHFSVCSYVFLFLYFIYISLILGKSCHGSGNDSHCFCCLFSISRHPARAEPKYGCLFQHQLGMHAEGQLQCR